jgi:hypothetical protein
MPMDALVRDSLSLKSLSIERSLLDCLSACLDVTVVASARPLPLFDSASEMDDRFLDDTSTHCDVVCLCSLLCFPDFLVCVWSAVCSDCCRHLCLQGDTAADVRTAAANRCKDDGIGLFVSPFSFEVSSSMESEVRVTLRCVMSAPTSVMKCCRAA